MLRNVTQLKGFAIRARNGEVGTLDQFYFDDEIWAIRYLVVNTGGWLAGRLVLVSPIALCQAEWQSKRLDVALTKKQIKGSPSIDTHKPVSRQHEAVYLGYYGYPQLLGWTQSMGPCVLPGRLDGSKGSADGSGSGASAGGKRVGRFTSAQHRRGDRLSHRRDGW